MALGEASHHIQKFRSPEIHATGIRTCPDVELGEECEDQCYLGQGSNNLEVIILNHLPLVEVFLDCVENCESNECISECNRSVTECEADCPCQTNCPDGCTGPGIIFLSHNDKDLTVTSGKDVASQYVVLRQPQALQQQPRHSLNLVFSFSIHTSQQINQHFSIQMVK